MKARIRYTIEWLLIVVFIYVLYFYLAYPSKIGESVRFRCTDFLFQISSRFSHPSEYEKDFAVLGIDEEAISKFGLNMPLKKDFLGDLLSKLEFYNPKMVVLYFLFAGEDKNLQIEDASLAMAMNKKMKIAIPSFYNVFGNRVGLIKIIESGANKVGFINKIRDADSVIRKTKPFHISKEGNIDEYPLALLIAAELQGKKEENIIFSNPIESVYRIPVTHDGSMFINYQSRPEYINRISLHNLINNSIDPKLIKNKIVLIADTSEIGSSKVNTPFGTIPGIYVFINEVITFLNDKYIIPLQLKWLSLITFFLMTITCYLIFNWDITKGLLFTSLICPVIFILSIFLLNAGYIIDFFSILFPLITTFLTVAFFKYFVLLEANIIELKNAYTALQEAQKEIIQKEQLSAIGRTTSKILHEIRGPLANIKSCFSQIKTGTKTESKIQRITQLAGDEIDRMIQLSEQLRKTYNISTDDLKPININELLLESLELSEERFRSRKILFTDNLSKSVPDINVSPSRMKEVFINIINNALDALPDGGTIDMSTFVSSVKDRKFATIAIKDNGFGIKKDDLPKIFDAFFSTKKDLHGSGLGLFICNEIVKAHKGFITADSAEGKGSVFTIYLPV